MPQASPHLLIKSEIVSWRRSVGACRATLDSLEPLSVSVASKTQGPGRGSGRQLRAQGGGGGLTITPGGFRDRGAGTRHPGPQPAPRPRPTTPCLPAWRGPHVWGGWSRGSLTAQRPTAAAAHSTACLHRWSYPPRAARAGRPREQPPMDPWDGGMVQEEMLPGWGSAARVRPRPEVVTQVSSAGCRHAWGQGRGPS